MIVNGLNTITICLLSCSSLFGQPYQDSALIGKWYYCGNVREPGEINTLLFYREPPACNEQWYWRFKEDRSLELDDSFPDETIPGLSIGFISVIDAKWKLDFNRIVIGETELKIDAVTEKHLILRRMIP